MKFWQTKKRGAHRDTAAKIVKNGHIDTLACQKALLKDKVWSYDNINTNFALKVVEESQLTDSKIMDNLQVHYHVQLATAKEKVLEGDVAACLDRCFELRLKPDLAPYTRALVCLTICDMIFLEDYPQKLDIAYDALRLAVELKVS